MPIEATRLETDEEVRQALLKYQPAAAQGLPPRREPAPPDDAPPVFRPTQRPPTPVLLVFDDGADDGEWIRIRQEAFTIGRSEGDLKIGHDSQISSRHAALEYKNSKGKGRWQLVDLGSTNGTYVRIGHAVLEHGQEFVVGRARFRFEEPARDKAQAPPPPPDHQATRPWQNNDLGGRLAPSLVQADSAGGKRLLLAANELWIGKDAGYCQVVLADDPFASARHARVYKDSDGRWVVENNRSPNGVWLRIKRLSLADSCRFLLGEQQFMVRIPR
jgi:pSer/pThr/pTyr-binding forkhead associated (FHA) protein